MTDPPKDAADSDYFEQIESSFARLRGTPLLLSPKDWALVASWRKAGIPLRVVLEALEAVFTSRLRSAGESTPRPVLSLGYCEHAVKEAFDAWREARLGAPSGESSATAQDHQSSVREAVDCLQGWIEELQPGGRNTDIPTQPLQEATQRLQHLVTLLQEPDAASLAQVEEQLEQTEDRMLDQLLQTLPSDSRQKIEEEVRQELHALQPRLTQRAYDSTFQVHLRGRLRTHLRLPRLTLYQV